MTAQSMADRYFDAMIRQDVDDLLALFTPDAIITWPDGRDIAGHDAIQTAYTALFTRPTNNPQPGPLMAGEGRFAVEVLSLLADGSARRTINVFETDGSALIARLRSYKQG